MAGSTGNPLAAGFKFNRMELAGSLGDLGTLIPMALALIALTGLKFTPVVASVGLFYVLSGLYFRLPLPVQPLKLVAAVAIAYPHMITLPLMSACAISFGVIMVFLAVTGLIDRLARLFTRPVVRGIQLGLGFILIKKGLAMFSGPELFLPPLDTAISLGPLSLNLLLGVGGVVLVLFLLNSTKMPAALALMALGVMAGLLAGAGQEVSFTFGPSDFGLVLPAWSDFPEALWLLVLPQIPLTIGNAVVGTKDTALSLFGQGRETGRISNRSLSMSMGLANLSLGLWAAMPLCHGAGGLAAHYRFGARTGGSSLIIGLACLVLAFFLGEAGVGILAAIPRAVLGVLLVFAGLELGLLVRDLTERSEFFVALCIAAVALASSHMGLAFVVGMVIELIIKKFKVII